MQEILFATKMLIVKFSCTALGEFGKQELSENGIHIDVVLDPDCRSKIATWLC